MTERHPRLLADEEGSRRWPPALRVDERLGLRLLQIPRSGNHWPGPGRSIHSTLAADDVAWSPSAGGAICVLLDEAGGQFQTWSDETVLQELPGKFTGGWLAATTGELLAELRRVLRTAIDAQATV